MTEPTSDPSATPTTTDQPAKPTQVVGQTASPPSSAGTPPPSTPATPSPGEAPKTGDPAPPAATPEGTTDGPKAGEDAPKEGDKPEGEKPRDASGKFAPDYSKLKFEDGFAPDEAALAQARELFAEAKLPAEQAQKLVDFYQGQQRAQAEAWVKQSRDWAESVKADPELGGPKWGETNALMAKGRDAYATPELLGLMDGFGFGNHPAVVRLFRDLGKAVAEDRLVTPGAPAARSDPYPNTPGMRP